MRSPISPITRPPAGPIVSAVLVLHVMVTLLTWEGFGPRDVEHYVEAALSMARGGGVMADDHWALRWPVVLPLALSLSLLPGSMLSACLPSIAFGMGLSAVNTFFGMRWMGREAGIALGVLTALSPFLTMLPAELRVMGPETLFAASAVWFVLDASLGSHRARRRRWLLVGAGLLIGAAWLCRESTAFLGPTLAALSLLLSRKPRLDAPLLLALSGGGVLMAELLTYWALTGDPFYRLGVSMGHGGGAEGTQALSAPRGGALQFLLMPLRTLLAELSLLPSLLLGVAGTVFLAVTGGPGRDRAPFITFAACGAASFLTCAYLLSLEEPEYYPLVGLAFLLPAAAALGRMARMGRAMRLAALLVLLGYAGAAYIADDLRDDQEYRQAERLLASAREAGEPVYAGGGMLVFAGTLAALSEEEHLVAPFYHAPPGSLVWSGNEHPDLTIPPPQPGWSLAAEIPYRRPSPARAALRTVLPLGALPERIGQVLDPPDAARLYRLPQEAASQNDKAARGQP